MLDDKHMRQLLRDFLAADPTPAPATGPASAAGASTSADADPFGCSAESAGRTRLQMGFLLGKLAEQRAQQLAENRRRTVRRVIIGSVLALGVVLVFSGAVKRNAMVAGAADQPHVALVSVSGEIGPGSEASVEKLGPALERAFADRNAKGVVLLVNSPGGTPVQSSLIYERIRNLKSRYPDKKVLAVGEDMVTSGAYMIAMAADEIIVNPSSVVGSIGVVSRGFGFSELIEKLGVERRVATAGAAKNLLDPFAPVSEAGQAKQAELLSDVHGHFIELVTEARGERLTGKPEELFTGEVWTGARAVDLGLADRLGSLTDVLEKDFDVREVRQYRSPRPILEQLLKTMSVSFNVSLTPQTLQTQAPVQLRE